MKMFKYSPVNNVGLTSVLACLIISLLAASLVHRFTHLLLHNTEHQTAQLHDPWSMFFSCETALALSSKNENVQLSDAQIMWVADMLHMVYSSNRKRPNVLIFGVGHDSPMWQQINCNGRTVFVEDDMEWIKTISGIFPALEIYHIQYQSSVREHDFFLENPQSININTSVDAECFDLILIDGPKGFSFDNPGRMIPAYYSNQKALGCSSTTVVFLHDMERHAEQDIADKIFSVDDGWQNMGQIVGPFGTLAGWILVPR